MLKKLLLLGLLGTLYNTTALTSTQDIILQGEFVKLAHTDSMPEYWLRSKTGANPLYFDSTLDVNINPGDVVFIKGKLHNAIGVNVSFYKVMMSPMDLPPEATDKTITSLTFVLDICDYKPISKTTLEQKWTNNLATGNTTLQNYFAQCSFDSLKFDGDNNIVVGPIKLPCNSTEYNYNSQLCGGFEIYGWAQHALDYTVEQLGIDVEKYQRYLFMLPQGVKCGWAGLGELGCSGSHCYTWYNGGYGLDLSVVMHELGHNFGLHHSTTPTDEYGDGSCAMGGCCGNRCYNAPQTWTLGITEPLVVLNKNNLESGKAVTFDIPSHLFNKTTFIKIDPDWVAGVTSSYFVSFVAPIKYNANLASIYKNKVLVHKFSRNRAYGVKPVLQANLGVGAQYVIGDINVRVTFAQLASGLASVSVCLDCSTLPPSPARSPPPSSPIQSPPPPAPVDRSPPSPDSKRSPPPPNAGSNTYITIKTPTNVPNDYITDTLCVDGKAALQNIVPDINVYRCKVVYSAGSGKYVQFAYTSQQDSVLLFRKYFGTRGNIDELTRDASIPCSSTFSLYSQNKMVLNYRASNVACVAF